MPQNVDLAREQQKDPTVNQMILFLTDGTLPSDPQNLRKVAAQAPSFTMTDDILFFLDSTKKDHKRCVVPAHLRQQVMEGYHSSALSGHNVLSLILQVVNKPPCTEAGNQHMVVFQDFLTKSPLVFPVPDQKAIRLARLLAEENVPLSGVPEGLLSDRGTNLLSHLMQDLCKMLA